MSKEAFYFTHDFTAFSDSKVQDLFMNHGIAGYGIYWHIVESLAQETNRWFLPKRYDRIAFVLRVEEKVIKSVVEDFGLFKFDEENFWCPRLDRHFDKRAEKSKKARESVMKRWDNAKKKDTNVKRTKNDSNTIKERKGKERKVKETTSSSSVNTEPTPKQIATEFFENINKRKELAQLISEQKNIPLIACVKEIEKFTSYWTELNPSGKKQRWEAQKFFDLRRRIGTWFRNAKFEMKQDIIF